MAGNMTINITDKINNMKLEIKNSLGIMRKMLTFVLDQSQWELTVSRICYGKETSLLLSFMKLSNMFFIKFLNYSSRLENMRMAKKTRKSKTIAFIYKYRLTIFY